jgi:hypothetical protein
MRRALPLLALLALLPRASARADGPAAPAPAAVRAAIDRGAAFLRARFRDGFPGEAWDDPAEVVVLALAHAGADLSDPVFAKGLERLERAEPRFTYRTACLAMALAEVNPRRHQRRIAHCAQWLVDTQLAGGEWGYPGGVFGAARRPRGATVAPPLPADAGPRGDAAPRPRVVVARRPRPAADRGLEGDLSNTQFAVLGLRACREAGVEVPRETWRDALAYLRRHQRGDGGWGYVVAGRQDAASYASLTCGGAAATAICLHALGVRDPASDPTVRRALAWLRGRLDVRRNAGVEGSSVVGLRPWQHFHLYALERAARVLGLAAVGERDWYAEGARWLLAGQRPDGSWRDDEGPATGSMAVPDTCFALLFLSRATKPLTGG